MRRISSIAIAVVMMGVCQAQDFTGQMANGRLWQSITDHERTFYVSGIHDHILALTLMGDQKPTEANAKWAPGFTIDDYVKELTLLYRDRENINIPVAYVFDYCTVKLKGKTRKDVLERLLMDLRGLAGHLSKD